MLPQEHPPSKPTAPKASPTGKTNTGNKHKTSRAGHGIGILGVIWAEDRSGILGADGAMLWRVPADFAHFKRTTMNCPVIMGRTSFESLGKPLPGRRNIILTRNRQATEPYLSHQNVEIADSIETALQMCAGSEKVWITGGGSVYQEVLDSDIADILVVSELDFVASVPKGAKVTIAPAISPEKWRLDSARSDANWRPVSGNGAWRVKYYVPR